MILNYGYLNNSHDIKLRIFKHFSWYETVFRPQTFLIIGNIYLLLKIHLGVKEIIFDFKRPSIYRENSRLTRVPPQHLN